MEVLEPVKQAEEETSRARNLRLLSEVMVQIGEVFESNLSAKFFAAPGFIGANPNAIDCEVVTLQVFLPRNQNGADVADAAIRKATGQEQRIVLARA